MKKMKGSLAGFLNKVKPVYMKRLGLLLLAMSFVIAPNVFCLGMAKAGGFSGNPDQIEEKIKSVVMISTFDKDNQPIATGSGFMAFDNMTVVTNYHVISDAYSIMAESDDGYYYIVTGIKIADAEKDIAILQLMTPTVMPPLEFATEKTRRGETIVTIGSPQGLKNSISTGIVSALYDDGHKWIQFTAPVSQGSSGGPVFNDDGLIIGMTTWNRKEGQNLNFALEITEVRDLYQQWDGQTISVGEYWVNNNQIGVSETNQAGNPETNDSGETEKDITRIKQIYSIVEVKLGTKVDLNDYVTVEPEGCSKSCLQWRGMSTREFKDIQERSTDAITPQIKDEHIFVANEQGTAYLVVCSKNDPSINEQIIVSIVP